MAGRIPDQFIDDLINKVDIVDLIESHLPLRKAGREFQALCPFHGEKTPSFTVSREKQFYHCFGCGAHGTAIGFMMNYRNLPFPEAVEELAQIAGMEVPREAGSVQRGGSREIYEVLLKARRFYGTQLRQADNKARAVDYLKRRGVSGEIAKAFQLGYAPAGWRNLYEALSTDGCSDELLERAGLVSRRDRGGFYDRLRDRIVFPIHDRRGRVIGFGGRIIDDGEPKYLNSPETEAFHKGRELYGLYESLQAGRPQRLLVVEGYMDVVALHQHGLNYAVATLGTAVTKEHLELLLRQAPAVTFCFDGDNAGRRAAWKALEQALPKLEGDREVSFAFLNEGQDPDSAVREHGADGFFAATKRFGLADYLIDSLKTKVDPHTAEGRTRLVALAKSHLLQIPDLTHRAAAVRRLARESQFDEDLIRSELGFNRRSQRRAAPVSRLDRFASRSLEERAAALVIAAPDKAPTLSAGQQTLFRDELDNAGVLLDVVNAISAGASSTAAIVERCRDSDYAETINSLAALEFTLSPDALETEISDAISRLVEKAGKQQIERIKRIPFAEWSDSEKALMRNHRRN